MTAGGIEAVNVRPLAAVRVFPLLFRFARLSHRDTG